MPVGGSAPIDRREAERKRECDNNPRSRRGDKRLLDNDRATVANTAMNRLIAIEEGVARGTRASRLLNSIPERTSLIAVFEAEKVAVSDANVERNDKITTQHRFADSMSTNAALATIMAQFNTLSVT